MRKPFYKTLYIRVPAAIVTDILPGHYSPEFAVRMKSLGDGFTQLTKMVVDPIIFCTVVSGIVDMRDMRKVGRVGSKMLFRLEVVSTLVLIIGLAAGRIFNPGTGFSVDVNTIDAKAVAQYAAKARSANTVDFLLNITPNTVVDTFAEGDILRILLIVLLFGGALSAMGKRAQMITDFIDQISHVFFYIAHVITHVAPIGAFGAVAFAIGKYGMISLVLLLKLVGTFYFTAIIFVVVVLGVIARVVGFNIFHFVAYIRGELLAMLSTGSLESTLPHLIEKMEKLGCSKSVVDLVVPTGYSFDLGGTSIYMMMAAIFILQALNTKLTQTQQLTILAITILTSEGAPGTIDADFITLVATLAIVLGIPVMGMVLVPDIDRFMNECRVLTNITGNGVTYVVTPAWERELDRAKLTRALSGDRNDEGIPATPAV